MASIGAELAPPKEAAVANRAVSDQNSSDHGISSLFFTLLHLNQGVRMGTDLEELGHGLHGINILALPTKRHQ